MLRCKFEIDYMRIFRNMKFVHSCAGDYTSGPRNEFLRPATGLMI